MLERNPNYREHLYDADPNPDDAYGQSLLVHAPYKHGVHRILTDLAWPWLIGYQRTPYNSDWWQYVDVDVVEQAKADS